MNIVKEEKESNDDYFIRYYDYNFIFIDFLIHTKFSF